MSDLPLSGPPDASSGPPRGPVASSPPTPNPSVRSPIPIVLGTALVVLAAVLIVMLVLGDDDDAAVAGSYALGESQGYLTLYEPADDVGPDPFLAIEDRVDANGDGTSPPTPGIEGEVGLYGGTLEQTCDPELLIRFLQQNPDKAKAWADVFGISVEGIPAFVGGLTMTVLTSDIRVTNHGFANGVATARQSVLPAGTAVMVDAAGVPKVRCFCGNPLLPPDDPDTPCTCPPGNRTTTTLISRTTTTLPSRTTTTTLISRTTTTTLISRTTTTTLISRTTTTLGLGTSPATLGTLPDSVSSASVPLVERIEEAQP